MNNFDSILHILYSPPDFDKTSPILIMENEISGSLLSNFLTSFSHFTTTWLINELGLSIESFSEDVKSEESLYAAIAEALTNDLILIFFFKITSKIKFVDPTLLLNILVLLAFVHRLNTEKPARFITQSTLLKQSKSISSFFGFQ